MEIPDARHNPACVAKMGLLGDLKPGHIAPETTGRWDVLLSQARGRQYKLKLLNFKLLTKLIRSRVLILLWEPSPNQPTGRRVIAKNH